MFAGFGISIYDANGSLKTADVVMGEVADKLNMVSDSAHRSRLAALVFGKSAGPEMIPMLNAGSEGIEGLMKRAAELGLVWSGIDSSNAEVFGDTMADVRNAVDGVVFSIGKQLLPILTDWGNEAISLITKHRELISVKVGEWLQRFNEYLPTLKEDLKGVWKFISNFAQKVDSLVQSLGGWEKVMPYIVAGIAAIKLAPLILSVGLLAKAFIGLGVAVLTVDVIPAHNVERKPPMASPNAVILAMSFLTHSVIFLVIHSHASPTAHFHDVHTSPHQAEIGSQLS